MTLVTSLIPGLDEIVQHGDPKRRAEAARRVADLFLKGASQFRNEHVDLFDGVLVDLVPFAERAARADLAEQLSVISNAPRSLVGQLAREDEISIAGPLLRRSAVIDDDILIEIARSKGQGHLLAMSERSLLSSGVTDFLVRRGDREVVRRTAGNAGALFSQAGYATLIKRAGQDGALALKVGQRDDLSAPQLKQLLIGSMDVVRRRLFEVVKPARQNQIMQALQEISGGAGGLQNRRNYVPAQRIILALHQAGELNERALLGFAKDFKFEEAVAALSAMSGVKIVTLDRVIGGDRYDPLLIVGKAIGLEWPTVRALILLRLGPSRVSAPADIETARLNYSRMMPTAAERVVSFWRTSEA
jgi:uncharacterized protein (DUF2336 family)